jgi:hypothetical protein
VVPVAPEDSPATFSGPGILAVILVLFAAAAGISLYFWSPAPEFIRAVPSTVADTKPGSSIVPHPKPRRRAGRPRLVEAAQSSPSVQSSAPDASSGGPTVVDPGQDSSASRASSAADDLAAVRAKDPDAAERITVYCTKVAAGAADSLASERACHRNEVAAWTRLVVDQEFPSLDAATLAICSEPPFPDSYEGREACARYKLHIN